METRVLIPIFAVCCAVSACVVEDDCRVSTEEIPLGAFQGEGEALLAHEPPLVFMVNAGAVWALPEDTVSVRALVSLSDYGEPVTVRASVSEYDLDDTLSGSTDITTEYLWVLKLDEIVEMEHELSDEVRPKSFLIENPSAVTPLNVLRIEVDRRSCS